MDREEKKNSPSLRSIVLLFFFFLFVFPLSFFCFSSIGGRENSNNI